MQSGPWCKSADRSDSGEPQASHGRPSGEAWTVKPRHAPQTGVASRFHFLHFRPKPLSLDQSVPKLTACVQTNPIDREGVRQDLI